jgi:hypothetical protein
LNDKDVERVLKSLIDERSLIKLLKILEKEESIYKCKKIKIRENRKPFKNKLNQFYN